MKAGPLPVINQTSKIGPRPVRPNSDCFDPFDQSHWGPPSVLALPRSPLYRADNAPVDWTGAPKTSLVYSLKERDSRAGGSAVYSELDPGTPISPLGHNPPVRFNAQTKLIPFVNILIFLLLHNSAFFFSLSILFFFLYLL